MAKSKIPQQATQVLDVLKATGLPVAPMTPEDLEARIPLQYKEMFPSTYLSGYEIDPVITDKDSATRRQLIVIYDEQAKDAQGKPIGKPAMCIKLFDRITNLTTMDAAQIRISPTYITRMNYRLDNDGDVIKNFSKNVMDNVLSFRKIIDDPAIVTHK